MDIFMEEPELLYFIITIFLITFYFSIRVYRKYKDEITLMKMIRETLFMFMGTSKVRNADYIRSKHTFRPNAIFGSLVMVSIMLFIPIIKTVYNIIINY